ncbi:MAG: hypothetical protein JWP02_1244 [Acidimicrobiales bacterium]|nr:hypothetical protein [Acidimicrobiales bacterium]
MQTHQGHGELHQVDDRWELRFTRVVPHPPEKVWRALTEAEHRKVWFPDTVEGEFAPGATLRFVSDDDAFPPFEGKVLTYDPPRVLEHTWGADIIRFVLEPDDDGTVLTLTDTITEVGKAARDGAGWHECLDWLESHLAAETPTWAPMERWSELHPDYVERFGPEASTIGPPEGMMDR